MSSDRSSSLILLQQKRPLVSRSTRSATKKASLGLQPGLSFTLSNPLSTDALHFEGFVHSAIHQFMRPDFGFLLNVITRVILLIPSEWYRPSGFLLQTILNGHNSGWIGTQLQFLRCSASCLSWHDSQERMIQTSGLEYPFAMHVQSTSF